MEPDDHDDVDDLGRFRTPPSPDDRLWRHPSELAAAARATASPARARPWGMAIASAALGSVATVGLLAATGSLDVREPGPRAPVVRQAEQVLPAEQIDTLGAYLAADGVRPAIVRLEVIGREASVGTGVLFRADGHLLTSAHVVAGAQEIRAVLADGRRVTGAVVGADAETDVAVVRLLSEGPYPVASIGTVSGLLVGQPAVAVGAPLRLDGQGSVAGGVLTALGREVETEDGAPMLDMIETDATIHPGSSGGALVNDNGEVIGITTAYGIDAEIGERSVAFATPIDVAVAVAADLLAGGPARPAWLGVRGSDDTAGGALLVGIVAGSPAAQGLSVGDVVLSVDQRPVSSMSSLRIAMRVHQPGDQVTVGVRRDTQVLSIPLTLGDRPPTER